ncbi:hypothetical protein [Azospirillum doebereinerae]|uniref:hypothetical protein n=1 Tax=Azospirillum doebereinerae TaxID=92933 RepID=UPI00163C9E1F|nr:hypothetical protein [Azospirillum doebereinerae]
MKKRHSFARVIVASSFALIALITAASATVSIDATPAPVGIDRASVLDSQLFLFN